MRNEVKKMTEMRDVTGDVGKFDIEPANFTVKTDYQSPNVVGFDKLKGSIEQINNRYSNLVVQSEQEAHELSKRGGTLTKLRKVIKAIQEHKRQVHREAKQSYAQFDNQMNELLDLAQSAYDNVKEQTDDFKEKEKVNQLNALEKIFDEQVQGQFANKTPKWCDFALFTKFNSKTFQKSEKTQRKEIVQFLYQVYQDQQKMREQYQDYHSSVFVNATLSNYKQTLDVNQAIVYGIQEHKKALEIAKAVQQQNQQQKEAPKSQEQQSVSSANTPNDNQQATVIHQQQGEVYYMFAIKNLDDARAVKQLLDERGAVYKNKTVPIKK